MNVDFRRFQSSITLILMQKNPIEILIKPDIITQFFTEQFRSTIHDSLNLQCIEQQCS